MSAPLPEAAPGGRSIFSRAVRNAAIFSVLGFGAVLSASCESNRKTAPFDITPTATTMNAPCAATPNPAFTPGPTVSYSAQVQPLLAGFGCAGCHTGASPSSGYDPTTYGTLFGPGAEAQSLGECDVTGGVGAGSFLVRKLAGSSGIPGVQMPSGGPYMSPAQVALVQRWIDQGAFNN